MEWELVYPSSQIKAKTAKKLQKFKWSLVIHGLLNEERKTVPKEHL